MASKTISLIRKEYGMPTTASTADQNREFIRQVYTLANAGELEQIAPFYAGNYRLTQSPGHPVPGSWVGQEATEASIRVFNTCGTHRVTIHEIIADGPHRVIGIVDAHGTTPGGRDWTMPVSEHFWIEDGKITDIRPFYWDPARLRRIIDMA
jgi:ketosteroid isomerase-like protein